jgi:hypothetical protein
MIDDLIIDVAIDDRINAAMIESLEHCKDHRWQN